MSRTRTTAPSYDTIAWRRARTIALDRARHRCERCGLRVELVVHHRDKQGVTGPHAYDAANLVVLCRTCHAREHEADRPWPPSRSRE